MVKCPESKCIALAGNPNVGKSTVFNALTGMRQHTGNWAGKTVENASGSCHFRGNTYRLFDLPGCWSLSARSPEEAAARDFLCLKRPDAVIVICDATCLERSLNLALQIMEAGLPTLLGVNLMDEAKKKKIRLDLDYLSGQLHVPVIGLSARRREGLDELMDAAVRVLEETEGEAAGSAVRKQPWAGQRSCTASPPRPDPSCYRPVVHYPEYLEEALSFLSPAVHSALRRRETASHTVRGISARWLSLRLLEHTSSSPEELGIDPAEAPGLRAALTECDRLFQKRGITSQQLQDDLVSAFVTAARLLCRGAVAAKEETDRTDRRLDQLFCGKYTAFPIMLLLLLFLFWLTISGANYPSALLQRLLFSLEEPLERLFLKIRLPEPVAEPLLHGVYRTVAWVISVMLPPMAIFFPLFTLLEDLGYLPRIAFNLDRCFQCCHACGKQALTMAMGFGCNAAGVTGCRIIDSGRERLIAILTNAFVPCNGRFPTLILLISLFLVPQAAGSGIPSSLLGACILVGVILLGILMTFLISALLSHTLLQGEPSSFTLELPSYRRPQIGRVILRSVADRTVKVLTRALLSAAPAGLLIWLLANLHTPDGMTWLSLLTGALDPPARLLGMDGTILTGFLLGLPANEIVIPIIVMAYSSQSALTEMGIPQLHALLLENGWTWVTAVCTLLFSLMHWPCATTLLTIQKETGSLKWTAAAFLIPTLCGAAFCFLFQTAAGLFL